MSTDAVGREYLKETNMMFIGGLMVAIGVEHSNLHRRIALKVSLQQLLLTRQPLIIWMNDNNAGLNDDNHRNYTVNVYMGLQVFLATSIENGRKNLREIL